jgi:predicted metal-dependent hydrolase
MFNVTLVRSSRRKSIAIQVKPDMSVTVTAPTLYPKFMINRLLEQKKDWIEERLQLLKARTVTADKNTYLYLGKPYKLEKRMQQKQLIEVADKIYIASPSEKNVKTYLTSWYRQQARKIIVQRVYHYAEISGAKFRSINLTSAETRWGSCSSEKTLNFNWKLIMAPLEVIDYVICHELAHLTEMNHSRAFWETVRKMYPLYREYRTWLKRHGHSLTI